MHVLVSPNCELSLFWYIRRRINGNPELEKYLLVEPCNNTILLNVVTQLEDTERVTDHYGPI